MTSLRAIILLIRYILLTLARTSYRRDRRRHLWLFASSFPPNTQAGVYRPYSFVRYAAQSGWRVTVFTHETTPDAPSPNLLEQLPDSCRVVRVRPWPRLDWRLEREIDGGLSTVLAFVRAALQQSGDRPSAVLATGPTFNMFLAARFAAAHVKAPLILDYRDEWSECPFDFVENGPRSKFWERFCLRGAAHIYFSTQSMLTHAISRFGPSLQSKCSVLHNGWDDEEPPVSGEASPRSRKRLLFLGNLAEHTDPAPFLSDLKKAIDLSENIQSSWIFSFVGPKSAGAQAALREFSYPNIEQVGWIPKKAIQLTMRDSDALLLIVNPEMDRYIPSKLFDYLRADRPIIVYGSCGEAGQIVQELGAGYVVDNGGYSELSACLTKIEACNRACTARNIALHDWVEDHRRDRIVSKLYVQLDALCNQLPLNYAKSPATETERIKTGLV